MTRLMMFGRPFCVLALTIFGFAAHAADSNCEWRMANIGNGIPMAIHSDPLTHNSTVGECVNDMSLAGLMILTETSATQFDGEINYYSEAGDLIARCVTKTRAPMGAADLAQLTAIIYAQPSPYSQDNPVGDKARVKFEAQAVFRNFVQQHVDIHCAGLSS